MSIKKNGKLKRKIFKTLKHENLATTLEFKQMDDTVKDLLRT